MSLLIFFDLLREEVRELPDLLSARVTAESDPAMVRAILRQGIKQAYRRAVRRFELPAAANIKTIDRTKPPQ